MSKNDRSKKFREKYVVVPIHPLMPRAYSARERAELKKWEQEIMNPKSNEKNIGKEPGE